MDKIDFNKEIDNNNKIVIKIFNYIKLQDWTNLLELIKTNDIDYNIRDQSGIYLIEYAILFNQVNIINILLEKNTRIDITDDYNRSLLYNVIKFSYLDILKLFLDKNKNTFGKNILDIKDKEENVPLFYAIKFFNIEAIRIISSYTENFFVKNIDGENALHLAIKSQNLEIFKIIFEKNNLLKSKNTNGENSLHLVIKFKCYEILKYIFEFYKDQIELQNILNLTENRYNFTTLHYICVNLDYQSLEILNNYNYLDKIDGNVQDNSGNIFYHYYIKNIFDLKQITKEEISKLNNFNELIKKVNFNFNIYNVDGNTPCHLMVKNINFFKKNNLSILINYVIDKTNLNLQNFSGESVLLIIIKNNFWLEIKNLLIHKKLDIFIITNDNKTIFDYLKTEYLKEFIDIVTQSYINKLQNSPDSITWLDYWDNRCKKNIKDSELNVTEHKLIKSFDIKELSNDNKNNICYKIIYNKIKNYISYFLKNKNRYEVNSYPIVQKYVKLIGNYPNVNISTFTGSTLDVLCGLIYLCDKFNFNNNSNQIYTSNITSSLRLLDLNKELINCNIIDTESGNKVCEISGFEILWKNHSLYIPSNKNNDLNRLISSIIHKKDIRFLIIPIGIEQTIKNDNFSHANYLIFDFEIMEVERFEPHGSQHPVNLDYNQTLLDNQLENKINSIPGTTFRYVPPSRYLPKIGFQVKEISELKSDYIGDPNGFCALWCIWWADIRISNPNIPRERIVKILFKELINEKYSFKKLIRDYSYYILNTRDSYLSKANTNINEWINDTMSTKNMDLLNSILTEEIKKVNG